MWVNGEGNGNGGGPGSVIGTFLSFCDVNDCGTDPDALFFNVGDIRLLE